MKATQKNTDARARTPITTRWLFAGLVGAGLTIALTAGLAVADAGESSKPDRAALQVCKDEIQSVCGDVEPGEGRIRACIEAHKDELSPQCQQMAERKAKKGKKKAKKGKKRAMKQRLEEVCGEDIRQACGEVEPGDGRVRACIEENVQRFSPACQQALEEVRERRQD